MKKSLTQEEAIERAFTNGSRYAAYFDFGKFEISTVIEEDGLTQQQVQEKATEKLREELTMLNGGSDDFTKIQCIVDVLE